jgi:hypothetical protein
MKNRLFLGFAFLIAGCSQMPTLASHDASMAPRACFNTSSIRHFEPRGSDMLIVESSQHAWEVRTRGACPDLASATRVVFSDEPVWGGYDPWLSGSRTDWGWGGFAGHRSPWSAPILNSFHQPARICGRSFERVVPLRWGWDNRWVRDCRILDVTQIR